ncbi:MAG: hypothetical protein QOJ19_668 [Acidimicrobiia bacterium]|nr:hypothetical protein [Acidimicrobiia bacterium]
MARQTARKALDICEAALGAEHPAALAHGAALAGVLLDLGRFEEAEELLQRTLAFFQNRNGRLHSPVAVTLAGLPGVAHARGDLAEAERRWTEALDIKTKVLGVEHPDLAITLNNLGVVRYDLGRRDDAAAAWRQSLTLLHDVTPDQPARRAAEANLARLDEP